MNIKIPFFVRIRILDTHSSSLCLLPDIFFSRGMYRLCVRVCGCATRSGSLYQISHYIPNKSDFDFLRGNIFGIFSLLRTCARTPTHSDSYSINILFDKFSTIFSFSISHRFVFILLARIFSVLTIEARTPFKAIQIHFGYILDFRNFFFYYYLSYQRMLTINRCLLLYFISELRCFCIVNSHGFELMKADARYKLTYFTTISERARTHTHPKRIKYKII